MRYGNLLSSPSWLVDFSQCRRKNILGHQGNLEQFERLVDEVALLFDSAQEEESSLGEIPGASICFILMFVVASLSC